jgi:hydroxypyruvate reductase
MPDKVLVFSRFPKAMLVRFGERFELMDAGGKPPGDVFTPEQLSGIRAMITSGSTLLGGAAMDALPKLGAIVCYGTGYDGLDLAAAAKRGIAVGNSPGANAASVADLAVTLMLAVTRRLLPADNYVRSGNWAAAKPSPLMRPQVGNPGRKVGVWGMGEIGRKIAARVAAFETEVGLFQPQPTRRAVSLSAEPGSAGGMVQRADDRGPRRRGHPSRRRCRISCANSARTALSSTFPEAR